MTLSSKRMVGREFLRAQWRDLLLVTYAVPDAWLLPHLPRGLALDRHEGSAYVSLVAFDFRDTRVLGVRWPGFVNFPEVNLRFYVREGERRGVVFIREFVPSHFVAYLARRLYNEPYLATPMTSLHTAQGVYRHRLSFAGRTHRIAWRQGGSAAFPPSDSLEDFFKEHAWGYGRLHDGQTVRYHVDHPRWRTYPVHAWRLDLDFAALYGEPWGRLHDLLPISVLHAEGSAVRVHRFVRL